MAVIRACYSVTVQVQSTVTARIGTIGVDASRHLINPTFQLASESIP